MISVAGKSVNDWTSFRAKGFGVLSKCNDMEVITMVFCTPGSASAMSFNRGFFLPNPIAVTLAIRGNGTG
jgi:hypothetical protein